jgi:plasmid stability protein
MASITVRRLDDTVKARLRLRAAGYGRSMEQEAREILNAGLAGQRVPRLNLAESIRRHIGPLGGVELAFLPRGAVRHPPKLAK